ncbi:MAG: helix-turn-helix transcriptional regulator [Pseudomonadota bacterium]
MLTNNSMDSIFQALAHETRRTILDLLREHPGLTVGQLASHFDVSRIAVMNHLGVLEKAGLVASEKDRRSRRLYLNIMPIQLIYDRWTDDYSGHWAGRLASIKYAAEQAAKEKK